MRSFVRSFLVPAAYSYVATGRERRTSSSPKNSLGGHEYAQFYTKNMKDVPGIILNVLYNRSSTQLVRVRVIISNRHDNTRLFCWFETLMSETSLRGLSAAESPERERKRNTSLGSLWHSSRQYIVAAHNSGWLSCYRFLRGRACCGTRLQIQPLCSMLPEYYSFFYFIK